MEKMDKNRADIKVKVNPQGTLQANFINSIMENVSNYLRSLTPQLFQPAKGHRLSTQQGHQDIDKQQSNCLETSGVELDNIDEKMFAEVKLGRSESKTKVRRIISQTLQNDTPRGVEEDSMPKKPLTSFICFYRENKIKMRNKLQEVTRCYRVAQMMAEKWKSLSKSEKQPYEDMAEKDRIRYEIELEKYKEKHKEEIEEDKLRKKENKDKMLRLAEMKKNLLFNKDREKGERMEEEINTNMRNVEVDGKEKLSSVKTPQLSFFLFYLEQKNAIIKKYRLKNNKDISRRASQLWNTMSQSQRHPYQTQLQQSQQNQSLQEQSQTKFLDEYKESNKEKLSAKKTLSSLKNVLKTDQSKGNMSIEEKEYISPSSQSDSDASVSKQSLGQDKGKGKKGYKFVPDPSLISHRPKQPMSSFLLYYTDNISQIKKQCQGKIMKGMQIARYGSQKWSNLSAADKLPYESRGRQLRKQYATKYEQFKKDYPEQYELCEKMNKTKHLSPWPKAENGRL